MRKLNKYKTLRIFPRGVCLKKIPSRILNFRRPKWNFLQKKFPKKFKFSKKSSRYFGFHPKRKTITFFSKKSMILLWKRLIGSITLNDSLGLFLYSKSEFCSLLFKTINNKSNVIGKKNNFILCLSTYNKKNTKWKQKFDEKKSKYKKKIFILNPFLVIKSFKILERKKKYYKNSFETKTALLNTYENSISFNKLKKNVYNLKRYNILNYLIKPHFQLNILLSNLHFFSTPFQASQEIYNKKVLVNDKTINYNLCLKKGDIITFKRNSPFRYLKCFLQRYSFDNRLFSFIEVDYETETIIVIKNFFELGLEDFQLLIKDSIQLKNLTYL